MNDINTPKILIIDDETAILRLLTKALSRKGYSIDTADNGAVGIKKAVSNNYDFVITDIKMPGVSGVEVLHELKRLKGSGLPVIGMSGTPWLFDENLFDAVINKPCIMKELFEVFVKLTHPSS